ncbi:hypothetical protein KHP62_15460 [Rhodobacteraceae bacterium NNCM2]|nr:hypothetical protein [Coraliihabitans acroporae]
MLSILANSMMIATRTEPVRDDEDRRGHSRRRRSWLRRVIPSAFLRGGKRAESPTSCSAR